MSEKRDWSSFPVEEAKKKVKLDISSSSGSESSDKQEGNDSEETVSYPPATTVGVKVGNLRPLTENKPRNQDDTESSSGWSVPASSSYVSSGASANTSIAYKKRTLVYKKSLTQDDISKCRLMIPIEYGRKFLPEPQEHDGIYEDMKITFMDHNGQVWPMEASYDERSNCYMLWLNWDRYLKKFKLNPGDMIFFYHDPNIHTFDHYLIEYEKKGPDSNSKE